MKEFDASAYAVYDAKDKILGRLATAVAKGLLAGKSIAIINSEKAIMIGNRQVTAKRYFTRLRLQEKANPEHSPYWPRRPDMLVKRSIRGMLPFRTATGRGAYKRLFVFMGVPAAFAKSKPIEIKAKDANKIYMPHFTVEELTRLLGYNKR